MNEISGLCAVTVFLQEFEVFFDYVMTVAANHDFLVNCLDMMFG